MTGSKSSFHKPKRNRNTPLQNIYNNELAYLNAVTSGTKQGIVQLLTDITP